MAVMAEAERAVARAAEKEGACLAAASDQILVDTAAVKAAAAREAAERVEARGAVARVEAEEVAMEAEAMGAAATAAVMAVGQEEAHRPKLHRRAARVPRSTRPM